MNQQTKLYNDVSSLVTTNQVEVAIWRVGYMTAVRDKKIDALREQAIELVQLDTYIKELNQHILDSRGEL